MFSYRTFINQTKQSIVKNLRDILTFIISYRSNNKIPRDLSFNENIATSERDAANMFSSYLSSIYSYPTMHSISFTEVDSNFDLLNNITFSPNDVFKDLGTLRGVHSVGLDSFSG